VCLKKPLGGTPLTAAGLAGLTVGQEREAVCTGGFLTRFGYDEEGEEVLMEVSLGADAATAVAQTRFVYDEARNRIAQVDARGHLTTYDYDARNQRTGTHTWLEEVPPVVGRGQVPAAVAHDAAYTAGTLDDVVSYDANGNVGSVTDAKGQVRTLTYGLLNRLTSETYAQDGSREKPRLTGLEWGYSGTGAVTRVSERKETAGGTVTEVTAHGYDGLERRTSTTRYDGTVTTYGYDAKGNRTLVRDFAGVETKYAYDSVDRLTSVTTPTGVESQGYLADGLLGTTAFEDGQGVVSTSEARCYDAAGRLTALASAQGAGARCDVVNAKEVSRFVHRFDGNGNRQHLSETRGGGTEETEYFYDEADRLVATQESLLTTVYALDAVGNRVGQRQAPTAAVLMLGVPSFVKVTLALAVAASTSSFNAANWLTTKTESAPAAQVTSFDYDANGNRVTQTVGSVVTSYAWGVRDTLTAVTVNGSVVGRYDYDANFQRVKRDVGTSHTEYVLDGDFVLAEASGGATSGVTRRYHYGLARPMAVTDAQGSRWLLEDALGSVSDEVGVTGAVVARRAYDAWGNYRNSSAPALGEVSLGYTGHQYDAETGLTYARARYYDSKLGVFLSRDSVEGDIDDAPSLHRYAYAHENPLRNTDFSGHCPNCIPAAVGFIGGFVVGTAVSIGVDLWQGKSVDLTRAVNAGAAGAIEGGLIGFTMGGSLAVQAGAGVGGAMLGGQVSRTLDGRQTTTRDVVIDAGFGAVGVLGARLASAIYARSAAGVMDKAVAASSAELTELMEQQAAARASASAAETATARSTEVAVADATKEAEVVVAQEGKGAANEAAGTRRCANGVCVGGSCFVAGTQVLTAHGLRNIEDVGVGESVYSRDSDSGAEGWKPVLRVIVTPNRAVLRLALRDAEGHLADTFTVTPTHPFWVKGAGWKVAGDLVPGDYVANASGGWLRVDSSTWLQDGATVYNFEVADWHTYFVGESETWVHNASPGIPCPPAAPATSSAGAQDTPSSSATPAAAAPGIEPRRPRLPSDGTWTGVPGDSDFIPNRASLLSVEPDVVNVAPGTRIPFKGGDAVFDQFAWDQFSAPGLTGGEGDRRLMLDALASRYGMTRKEAVAYVKDRFLALHHAGGDTVQLIPGGIHGWTGDVAAGVPHRGAASKLRRQ
jgi:RHS repeat-associated protein